MDYKKTNKLCSNCDGRIVFDCEKSCYRCLNCETEYSLNESDELAIDSIYSNRANFITLSILTPLLLAGFGLLYFLYRIGGINGILCNSVILIVMVACLSVIIYNILVIFKFKKDTELFICMSIRFDYYRELSIYKNIGKKKNIEKTTKDFRVYSQWKYYINNKYKDYKNYSDFYRYLKRMLRNKKVERNAISVLLIPVIIMVFPTLMNGELGFNGLDKVLAIVIVISIIVGFMTVEIFRVSQEENYLNDLIEVLFGVTFEETNREPLKEINYYIAIDGHQVGPFGTNDISAFIKNGTLTADSLIWKKGMKEWVKAGSTVEMCSLFLEQEKSNPPPLPITDKK